MLDLINKKSNSVKSKYLFSILIPTWNNLPYLQNCIKGIQKNSTLDIQIIVIINEGKDKTQDWVTAQHEIDYVFSPENIGICYGLNIARSLIKGEYVVYMNDDMYPLPNWDGALFEEIKELHTKNFMLSSTMIEPVFTHNPCVLVKDYGSDLQSFNEEKLLHEYKEFNKNDWSGSMWPPNVMHIDTWDMVGGMSIEYTPGFYSDPDLARKLYEIGVRIFKGKGNSFVYHFGSKTTKRIPKGRGADIFLTKWLITSRTFTQFILKLGDNYTSTPQTELSFLLKLKNKFKRIKAALR